MRNKLFFFGDYVRTNDDSGRLTRGHVPEAAFRNGDFSSAPTQHLRSGDRQCRRHRTHAVREQPDSRRAASARSRASSSATIPLPNIPGAAVGATNFELPYVREKRTNQGDVKVTWQAAANDLVNVRYSKQNASTLDPATFGIYGGLKPFAGTGTNPTAKRRRRRTTASGRRPWCRKSASAARTTTTRRSPRTTGLNDLRGSRHQGHQPERLHERHHDDQRRRLQRLPHRLRDVAAVGSRREHDDDLDDRDQDLGQPHREDRRRPSHEPPPAGSGGASARVVAVPRRADGALDRQRGGERVRELARVVHARRAVVCRARPRERRRSTAAARTRASTPTSTTSGRFGRISRSISAFVTRSTRRSSDTPRRAAR